eukprot:1158496-Pelagomonas_calceolata.AAC.5
MQQPMHTPVTQNWKPLLWNGSVRSFKGYTEGRDAQAGQLQHPTLTSVTRNSKPPFSMEVRAASEGTLKVRMRRLDNSSTNLPTSGRLNAWSTGTICAHNPIHSLRVDAQGHFYNHSQPAERALEGVLGQNDKEAMEEVLIICTNSRYKILESAVTFTYQPEKAMPRSNRTN